MIYLIILAALCVAYLIWMERFGKTDVAHNLYYDVCREWGEGKNEDEIVLWLCNKYRLQPLQAYTLALMAKDNVYEKFVTYYRGIRTRKN